MIAEKIEKIKGEYTDKYVMVHAEQPELARFKDYVGQVKTVNMCGRALVEFEEFNQNIGWYDIDLDYLKVVDKPPIKGPPAKESKKGAATAPAGQGKSSVKEKSARQGKPVEKESKKKPAATGEKKLSPLELARQQGAASSSNAATEQAPAGKKSLGKPSASKLSTADILAAARGSSAEISAKGVSTKGSSAKESPPSAESKSDGSSQPQGGKLSTADILAAARGGSAKSPAKVSPVPETNSKPVAADAEVTELATPAGPIDKSSMTPDEMCTWCREHDA